MQLEVPLSFVLGSSHCQSWGDIFQIGFLQLVPFLLDKFFLPGHSFFHSFLLRNTLLSCIHLGLDHCSIQIVHNVFFLKLVQGLKAILNFHCISLSYGMAGVSYDNLMVWIYCTEGVICLTVFDTVPLFPVYQYIIKFGFATIWVHERPQLTFIALLEACVTNYKLTCSSHIRHKRLFFQS